MVNITTLMAYVVSICNSLHVLEILPRKCVLRIGLAAKFSRRVYRIAKVNVFCGDQSREISNILQSKESPICFSPDLFNSVSSEVHLCVLNYVENCDCRYC